MELVFGLGAVPVLRMKGHRSLLVVSFEFDSSRHFVEPPGFRITKIRARRNTREHVSPKAKEFPEHPLIEIVDEENKPKESA